MAGREIEILKHPEKIVVIGGGPAGASCAISLKKISRKMGKEIDVIIYEPKILEEQKHFNQCIGVMSHPFEQILRKLGVQVPESLIERGIEGYRLYGRQAFLDMKNPAEEKTFAARRSEFDCFLLEQAQAEGAQIIHSRVVNLEFSRRRAAVFTESNFLRCDCIVGAFGLDDAAGKMFEDATRSRRQPYRRPGYLVALITKLHPGKSREDRRMFLDERLGSLIHAILPPIRRIEFGAVTPKYDHLVVNIAGKDVRIEDMVEFSRLPHVQRLVPTEKEVLEMPSFFKGKFPLGLASGYYGDRYVMLGDAAGIMRPFKGKGINTAILSGIQAAETICHHGFSEEHFRRHYAASQAIHEIVKDMYYGRTARRLAIYLSNTGKLDRIIALARTNARLHQILYDAVSGNTSYRDTFMRNMNAGLFLKLAAKTVI